MDFEGVQHRHTRLAILQQLQHDTTNIDAEVTSQRRLVGLVGPDVDGVRVNDVDATGELASATGCVMDRGLIPFELKLGY
jgi:hypothetical protein